ncbi:MAG: hypothetical protein N0E44_18260 [Candidatus Thiodiazotropha lotti]|nr:hypothetical protein [Candidatus Thiodiazotropha lotti]MCW4221828.1 hypothetical protein [Candidatus Thiodiazotropha lotti]
MHDRYFNDDPYPLIQGDNYPPYVFTIHDSLGQPADFSGYSSLVVRARFREQGGDLSLAVITCTAVDKSIGQFRIDSWPAAVAAAEEGTHELEIEVDYLGDSSQVQTVYDIVKFKVFEQFGDTA